MSLSPELADLKVRCIQALQWKASLARVALHLEAVGAGPVPTGLSAEQHLLNTLEAMAKGEHKPVTKAEEPVKAEEPKKKGKKGENLPVPLRPLRRQRGPGLRPHDAIRSQPV